MNGGYHVYSMTDDKQVEVRGLYGVHNMEAIYTGPIDLDKVMEFVEGALGTFEYGATYYTREQLNELQRYCVQKAMSDLLFDPQNVDAGLMYITHYTDWDEIEHIKLHGSRERAETYCDGIDSDVTIYRAFVDGRTEIVNARSTVWKLA